MLFDELVLDIMKAVNKERTVSSPYHLIKGKKSGQTIQDIGYYQLYPYFSVLPRLEKPIYDEAVDRLFALGLLKQNEDVIDLSSEALERKKLSTLLNGWKYRGKEALFMNRLSLIVQTFSHISQQVKRFDPVVNAEDIQLWVKMYLRKIDFRNPEVVRAFKQELFESLEKVPVSDDAKMIVLQRLSGHGMSGLTWEQIAATHHIRAIDAQLQSVETVHGWLEVIEQNGFPLLSGIMEGVIQLSSLTEPARRTEKLFGQGFSLEQIASLRQLKTSTIEDHFVELAMNDPYLDHAAFISEETYQKIIAVSKQHQTKRLRDIKEKVPEATYFQIRLALAVIKQ